MNKPKSCPATHTKCFNKSFTLLYERLDNDPPCAWFKCDKCGCEFNHWYCSIDYLKQVFGQNWELYI